MDAEKKGVDEAVAGDRKANWDMSSGLNGGDRSPNSDEAASIVWGDGAPACRASLPMPPAPSGAGDSLSEAAILACSYSLIDR